MFKTLKQGFKPSLWLNPTNLLLGLGLYGINEYKYRQTKNKMCGIVAYVGEKPIATEFALHGIDLLQNRGYDSAGICTVNDGKFVVTKFATDHVKKRDAIEELKKWAPTKHENAYSAIGHTRWATCGSKTDFNAHPHTDYVNLKQKDRIALVHNGTIENIEELREELNQKGIECRSETDSEMIAQMIGLYLDSGLRFYDAVKSTLEKKIQGTWGLCIMHRDEPDRLIIARKGSPIQIGLHPNGIFVASENLAFEKYTENFLKMNDGELIYIDLKNKKEFYKNVQERIQIVSAVNPQTSPRLPYKHFYDQEVMDQPDALMKCLNYGARLAGDKGCTKLGGLNEKKDLLLPIKHCYIIGCGTSYYAGQFAKRIYHHLNSFETVQVIEGSEFTELEMSEEAAGVILISQSGSTADVYRALQVAKAKGLPTIGVTNVVGSQIATEVDCGVYLNAGREVAVPSTKTFSCSVLALVLIGIWFSHKKGNKEKLVMRVDLIHHLHSLPTVVGIVPSVFLWLIMFMDTIGKMLIDIDSDCDQVAEILKNEQDLYLLAKGSAAAIAKEGALKLKEIAYIHAESFVSGEIKHGPIALIDSGVPLKTKLLLIILNDYSFHDMQHALTEVKANHAYTIVITDCPEKIAKNKDGTSLADVIIPIPSLGIMTPLLAVMPLQKIGYRLAILRELNPDKPRNLAKTVTVH